ncbi:hypothetical protein GC176_23030 [bacterium]|nr:hypothetical protein [bacterium]
MSRQPLTNVTEPLAQRGRSSRIATALSAILLFALIATPAVAQIVPDYQGFSPLDSRHTPGMAARFMDLSGRAQPNWFQPIQIDVEDGAEVSVYHSRPVQAQALASPAQLSVIVGHTYRLRIRNIPEMPGVELFPTIEIIDRLHPPRGQEHDYPIPVNIDRKDIDLALDGNLVTRVVYLEQPQLAAPFELDASTRTRDIDAAQNALAEADRYGRPLLILRMGGRLPSIQGEPVSFYGTGGPIAPSLLPTVPTPATEDAQAAARVRHGSNPAPATRRRVATNVRQAVSTNGRQEAAQ